MAAFLKEHDTENAPIVCAGAILNGSTMPSLEIFY